MKKIKNHSLDIAILGYMLGYVFFFTCFTFGIERFDNIFFLWNNPFYTGIAGWFALYCYGRPEVKDKVKYPLAFSCIMYVWEIVVFVTGWEINNPVVELVLFLVLIGLIGYFMFKEFTRINKWLNKKA